MSKDIFKTKSFLFFSAFIFLILAILVALIVREEPDISEISDPPRALSLFSLNRSVTANPDNPLGRADPENLPITVMNSGDQDQEESERRVATLVSGAGSGQGVVTEPPKISEDELEEPVAVQANSVPEQDIVDEDEVLAIAEDDDLIELPNKLTVSTNVDQGEVVPEVVDTPIDLTGLSISSVMPEGAVLVSAIQDTAPGSVTTRIDLGIGTSAVVLRIEANNPISARSFPLTDPERVVLDLSGSWRVQLPSVPANNLVGSIRQGIQPDATRLVLDMRAKTQSVELIQIGTHVVELHIH